MGATEVVHGVSGSTMALMLGIYNDFIHALNSVDRSALKLLVKGKFASFWTSIHGAFLLSILLGIGVSLFTITRIISSLLQSHFIALTSFFFGIILISGILLLRKVKKWTVKPVIAFFTGIIINYFITTLAPIETPDTPLSALLGGTIAGFSVLFPGISSAFILIMIGKYQYIVTSFSQLNAAVIVVFFMGCLAGLWAASRLMYRILANYYSTTVALLAGLMLGALNKLWPWRKVLEFATNGLGEQIPAYDISILPWKYLPLTGKDPQVFIAIFMMALGVFIVVLIEKIAAGLKTKF